MAAYRDSLKDCQKQLKHLQSDNTSLEHQLFQLKSENKDLHSRTSKQLQQSTEEVMSIQEKYALTKQMVEKYRKEKDQFRRELKDAQH